MAKTCVVCSDDMEDVGLEIEWKKSIPTGNLVKTGYLFCPKCKLLYLRRVDRG